MEKSGNPIKILYCRNEGPFCGCWTDGWVAYTPEATKEEIEKVMEEAAAELTELTYDLCVGENEYDSMDEEDEYLERDDEIAAECACLPGSFHEATETWEELQTYGLTENWNENHTVCFLVE